MSELRKLKDETMLYLELNAKDYIRIDIDKYNKENNDAIFYYLRPFLRDTDPEDEEDGDAHFLFVKTQSELSKYEVSIEDVPFSSDSLALFLSPEVVGLDDGPTVSEIESEIDISYVLYDVILVITIGDRDFVFGLSYDPYDGFLYTGEFKLLCVC